MAAGAAQQSSGAADAEQQDDSVSRIEQESRELQQGSRAADNLDVRWSERLVLELPPDTEEDEARPYATLCWIPVLSQHHIRRRPVRHLRVNYRLPEFCLGLV